MSTTLGSVRAVVPRPSALPLGLTIAALGLIPATVLTMPAGVILRITWLPLSVT